MVSLGTFDGVFSPDDYPGVKNFTNHVYALHVGLFQGTFDGIAKYNNYHGVIIPRIGQLWPRPVWQYNDYLVAPAGTLGRFDGIYDYDDYGIIRNRQYLGQLWPRGDYIANATNEVKNG